MDYSYIINLETPAKKNSRINTKSGRSFPSKRYSEWHKEALSQLLRQRKPTAPIDSPIMITIDFTHGDLRRRDSDNGVSSILDLLTDSQIIKDDNWQIIQSLRIQNFYSKEKPSAQINITFIK